MVSAEGKSDIKAGLSSAVDNSGNLIHIVLPITFLFMRHDTPISPLTELYMKFLNRNFIHSISLH